MPSPATRAHKALLAVLAAMAILTGLIPAAAHPRPMGSQWPRRPRTGAPTTMTT
jgi:hypothetical protein